MGANDMTAVLHTLGLAVGHGRCRVVEDIHMQVMPGELVALIGVNGSGKSTLLRTLAGLLPPLAGKVLIHGTEVHALPASERARRIAMVLTGSTRPGMMDVRSMVALGRHPWTGAFGKLGPEDVREVEDALQQVGLQGLADRPLPMLSDGERQKVSIARAMAQATPLMLLDEPTAYLDLVNRVRIMRLLHDITRRSSKAVLLSTHDLRSALDLADRLVLVHAGGVWSGSPQDAIDTNILGDAFATEGSQFDPESGTLR